MSDSRPCASVRVERKICSEIIAGALVIRAPDMGHPWPYDYETRELGSLNRGRLSWEGRCDGLEFFRLGAQLASNGPSLMQTVLILLAKMRELPYEPEAAGAFLQTARLTRKVI